MKKGTSGGMKSSKGAGVGPVGPGKGKIRKPKSANAGGKKY